MNKTERTQFNKEFSPEKDQVGIIEINEQFVVFQDNKGKLWFGKPTTNESDEIVYYCRRVKLKKREND